MSKRDGAGPQRPRPFRPARPRPFLPDCAPLPLPPSELRHRPKNAAQAHSDPAVPGCPRLRGCKQELDHTTAL